MRQLVGVLSQYESTPFQYEATAVHAIRAKLCLDGWAWQDAQDEARRLVQGALDLMGARRPPAYMTQPEYALQEYKFTERTRCAHCSRPLPEDRPKFCSDLCNHAAKGVRERVQRRLEQHAGDEAAQLAWASKRSDKCAA
jgi:hypothetical protein